MSTAPKPRIFTVGHGDAPFHEIERLLHLNGVSTIVDVRSTPYSKHAPDFQKSALMELTAAAGFGYRWMGERLGGPATGGFDAALGDILALNLSGPVVLLCSERSPDACHRHLVLAPRLEATGVEVFHILPDGETHRYQPTLGI
jgi:uncharacterized protein (DUF488 family)